MKSTIEYFSGTKSASTVFATHGYSILTIDNDASLVPDICADILTMNPLAGKYDIAWFSPPCQGFSVAAIGKNWGGGFRAYQPKSDSAKLAVRLAQKTIEIIESSDPTWWFIENPRGLLRKMPWMDAFLARRGGRRITVTYCQYGDTRMKPTDIWTNALWWKPKPPCKNGASCHVAAPRGSKTGTQGIKGAKDRGRIPPALFEEILSQIP